MKKICILRNLLFLTVTIYCVLHFSALAEAEKWAISGTAATDDNIVTYFYVTANSSTASLTLTQDGKGRMRFIHNNGWGKTAETKDASSYARYTVNYKLSDNISWNYNDPYSWTPNSSFGKEWDDPVIFYYNEKQAATSTKTPTPASNQFYIWVNAGSTGNIRSAPTASGTWLGSEKEGTRLTAYDRVASQDSGGKDWYQFSSLLARIR